MGELVRFFIQRIKRDEIGIEAAALSFTSVLALVPAMTIVVSLFAMIPAFIPVKEELMRFASENFLPVFTDAIGDAITNFVAKAGSMTLTGSLMLFVVSLMMIRSVDHSLNRIWRGGKRRATMTFAIYWTMLTVGPLSFGIIVWVSTQLLATKLLGSEEIALALQTFYFILPFLVETAVIYVLYTVIPVADVRNRDALLGAVFVALSFELSKRIFATFILNFSDYEAIYGALAAAPVLMMWIYVSWWIILVGAEFTAVLGIVRGGEAQKVPKLIASLVDTMSSKKEQEHQIVLQETKELEQHQHRLRVKVSRKTNTEASTTSATKPSQNLVTSSKSSQELEPKRSMRIIKSATKPELSEEEDSSDDDTKLSAPPAMPVMSKEAEFAGKDSAEHTEDSTEAKAKN